MRNENFKQALVSFLIEHWNNDTLSYLLEGKKLFVTSFDRCYEYKSINGMIERNIVTHLTSTHVEADSRIMFHILNLDPPGKTVVRTSDTDILIILLGVFHEFKKNSEIWMEIGEISRNTLRYININQLHNCLGTKLSKSLLAFHAFTGSDYTSSFSRKGKIRPLKLLERDEEMQNVFGTLGSTENVPEAVIECFEKFVCQMYGLKTFKSTNAARLELFIKKSQSKKEKDIFSNIKRIEIESLPPCSKVVFQKVLRTNYICSIWRNATLANPPDFSPMNCGWVMEGGNYDIKWFEGLNAPTKLEEIYLSQTEDETNSEEIFSDDEECYGYLESSDSEISDNE